MQHLGLPRLPRRGVAPPAVLMMAAALFLTGCVSHHDSADQGSRVVRVSERDFRITAPRQLTAGTVRIAVSNRGPGAHELIVVKESGSSLPLRGDGLTVDEEHLERVTAGALEPGSPGSVRDLSVRLSPGRYVLFCNMSGHYLGGMHTDLVVQ